MPRQSNACSQPRRARVRVRGTRAARARARSRRPRRPRRRPGAAPAGHPELRPGLHQLDAAADRQHVAERRLAVHRPARADPELLGAGSGQPARGRRSERLRERPVASRSARAVAVQIAPAISLQGGNGAARVGGTLLITGTAITLGGTVTTQGVGGRRPAASRCRPAARCRFQAIGAPGATVSLTGARGVSSSADIDVRPYNGGPARAGRAAGGGAVDGRRRRRQRLAARRRLRRRRRRRRPGPVRRQRRRAS